ncbi:ABC transporter permease subunit [Aldersonia sp. NBC_00410]|uniref:ABC transporter permease n=1 Tax=Aldersonia sp. NBC_00410 TaxID=2975954 RepID=UPI002255235D|nr:ABC transporter permease subunit [Aldersonia sp. NBC_00410]MCX5041623.1 ABC transporter permease subunit [Aldersonia sp. NBC_00410]
MTSRLVPVGLLLPCAAVVGWTVLGVLGVLDYEYLSSPREIAAALTDLVAEGELVGDLVHTVRVAVIATLIGTALGGMLGFAIGLLPLVRRNVTAGIDVLRVVPAVALVPIALLALGPAVRTEVVLAVYAAVWPVVLSTAAGVAAVHPRQYDVARTLHLSRAATVRTIVVPAAVPAWLAGTRMAAVAALLVAIVAEMIMWPRGLGGGLTESLHALAPARMWAYALICGFVGFLVNLLLRQGVRRACPGSTFGGSPAVRQPAAPLRGLVPLVGALVVWQLFVRDAQSFPPPSAWFTGLAGLHDDGALLPAIGHTVAVVVGGLALATLIGTAVGIAIGASRWVDRALTPSVEFLAAVPAAAFVPIAVLLLGTSMASEVAVVALVTAWPILLETAVAMRTVPAVRLDVSRTLRLSTADKWRKVVLPTLAPAILLGVRIAAALALVVALLVEILGAGTGIGRLLVESQQSFDAAAAWGLLLVVGITGYLLSAAVVRIDGFVARQPSSGGPSVRSRTAA